MGALHEGHLELGALVLLREEGTLTFVQYAAACPSATELLSQSSSIQRVLTSWSS